ncbi:glycosyltransferase [Pedobacter nototheniae]|uniref:glycosyltransferase n=1 Tax=Pedobacter nototheniae TaxID=2488994 RepID=UPI00293060DD|nr:glycosyltransferase [Pedobacter nototheniae]
MQRVRMSLSYFRHFGWNPEVVMVDEQYTSLLKDPLLLESIPKDIKIHKIKAFSKKWTSKFGLGSLSLRSIIFYKKYVSQLIKKEKFDLIYFSTTEFPLTILGRYWKRKFGIPYVVDMQDPWHTDYYQNKPKSERPNKYWFSYRLNKYLEPVGIKNTDGLISVSEAYINDLKNRYPQIKNIPSSTITFGAFEKDQEISLKHIKNFNPSFKTGEDFINLVYVGRGGHDLQKSLKILFKSFQLGLKQQPENFKKLRIYFIGTSYAEKGTGNKTIQPLAVKFGIEHYIFEQTDRVGFYESLSYLQNANGLIIPASDDPQYTASKIFPYILAKKPLLAIFNKQSSAAKIIENCEAGLVADLNNEEKSIPFILNFLIKMGNQSIEQVNTNWLEFEQYSAKHMTKKQCELFDEVIAVKENSLC